MKYFYVFRFIAYPGIFITVVELVSYWNASPYSLVPLMTLKVVTSALLVAYVMLFKRESIFFFHNLGITTVRFCCVMMLIDTALFLIPSFFMLKFK